MAVLLVACVVLSAGARQQNAARRAGGVTRADVARFRSRLNAALSETHAARANWGILIVDRETGGVIYAQNADHFFTPASNAKLFTTTLALATLGPDYRFHTTLESEGPLNTNGTLTGDLILVGRGDPDLSNRKIPYSAKSERDGPIEKILAEMADSAVAKGLREVQGDIVADDSYFPYDPYPADWSVGDLFFAFGAPVSAIAFNDNVVTVHIQPGANAGEPAMVVTEPAAAIDTFSHEIATVQQGASPDFAVVRQPGPNFLLLRGTIPVGHSAERLDLAMTSPAETAAVTLKQLLEARGVRVVGTARARHAPPPETTPAGDPILPPAAPAATPGPFVLVDHVSQPLIETVRITNKVSNNLHAELLLRTVGREKFGVGSVAAGLKIERDFLNSAGVPDGDVVLSDGSGLSREDLVTPRAVVALLQYAARQTWGQDFISTLPIAGVDGTLQNRMNNTRAAGAIEAKTGEVQHVRGLSGFATTLPGETLVFSIFYNNNPQTGIASAAPIDAIAEAMVETLGNNAGAKKK